jgi:hypothetical protein
MFIPEVDKIINRRWIFEVEYWKIREFFELFGLVKYLVMMIITVIGELPGLNVFF